MKNFDLEKAKAGAPVCTRDGRQVRIVCFDAIGDDFPIIALITVKRGSDKGYFEQGYWYNKDGKNISESPDDDLMMAGIKHEGYVLIYPAGPQCIAHIYKTKEEAEEDAEREMIAYSAIAHIEWEE